MYRSLLVKYSGLREKEIDAMPMECWNTLVKFADWLDREADQHGAEQTNGGLCAICGRPEYSHSPKGHDYRPAISG